MYNVQPNHTNRNHTDQNHTNSSDNNSFDSEKPYKNSVSDSYDFTDKVNNPKINHNPFANLNPKYSARQAEISEIRNLISEVKSTPRTNIRVGRKDIPTYQVQSAFSRLTARHIEAVLDSLDKKSRSSNSNVKNPRNYILTTLYNVSNAVLPVDVDLVKSTVRNNINFDYLMRRYHDRHQQDHLQGLFDIIVEILISRKNYFRIAKGDLPADVVKRGFCSLTSEHVAQVLDNIRTNNTDVKSTKAYIQTSLWNSLSTINIQTTFDVNLFLFEHLGIEKI